MSAKLESLCVGCKPDLPCIGPGCPYYGKRTVWYCDECGVDNAIYEIEGKDYCEDCAKEIMKDAFANLSLSEMAEALEPWIDFGMVEDGFE